MNIAEKTGDRGSFMSSEVAKFVEQYDPQAKIGAMADLLAKNFGDLVDVDDICEVWGAHTKTNQTLAFQYATVHLNNGPGQDIQAYTLTSFGQVKLLPPMHEGNWYIPPARQKKIPPQASPRVQDFLSDMLAIQISSDKARSLLNPGELTLLLDLVCGTRVTNQDFTQLLREKMRVAGYDEREATIVRQRVIRRGEGYYYLAGSIFNTKSNSVR